MFAEIIDAQCDSLQCDDAAVSKEDALRLSFQKAFQDFVVSGASIGASATERNSDGNCKRDSPVASSATSAHDLRIQLSTTSKECSWDTTCEAAFADPGEFLRRIEELARESLPLASRLRFTYPDGDGDECLLVEATVPDALCSAGNTRGGVRLLHVNAHDLDMPVDEGDDFEEDTKAPTEVVANSGRAIADSSFGMGANAPSPENKCVEPAHDAPHDPAHDLRVLLRAPACRDGSRTFDLVAKRGFDSPAEFMQRVSGLAEELLPGMAARRVTYVDDEGDACLLGETTVAAALCMAKPAGGSGAISILELCVSARSQPS